MQIKPDTWSRSNKHFQVFAMKLSFAYRISPRFSSSFEAVSTEMFSLQSASGKSLPKWLFVSLANQTNHEDYAKNGFKASVEMEKWRNTFLCNELDLIASMLSKQIYRRVESKLRMVIWFSGMSVSDVSGSNWREIHLNDFSFRSER